MEVSSPSSEGERTLTKEELQLNLYDSDSEGKDDSMASGTIIPLPVPMRIIVPKLGTQGEVKALIDSGCIQCLISLQTVQKLGL